jgi:hypothetical protein
MSNNSFFGFGINNVGNEKNSGILKKLFLGSSRLTAPRQRRWRDWPYSWLYLSRPQGTCANRFTIKPVILPFYPNPPGSAVVSCGHSEGEKFKGTVPGNIKMIYFTAKSVPYFVYRR